MIRVVITGIGLVTPLGRNWGEFCGRVKSGASAIQRRTEQLEGFPDLTLPVAAVADFDPARDLPNCKIRVWDRLSHFALYAARAAVADAGISGENIDALILGSSTTSVETLDENYWRFLRGNGRISPMMIARCMPNAPVSAVSMDLGIRGASHAVASACSSSNHAIISAASQIRSGAAKTAIAGGVEASLSYSNLSAWKAMHVLSDDGCRPFCATRSGLVMGEGAALFVLEDMKHASARSAHVHAELLGWGQSSDARSLTTPDREGIEAALRNALNNSGMDPRDIDYVNAHGTGTELNDSTEAAALTSVLGEHSDKIPVSSTKSLHGHLLGAAGGIELAATLSGIAGRFVPPNVGVISQDEDVRLNVSLEPAQGDITTALSASYAFGGHNTVLAVSGAF